jgi:uncharacterized protein YndB with AHSA1/START domain
MISIESTVSVERPADEVFAFIADVRNDPRWHTDVLDARLVKDTVIGRGSTFQIRTKPVMGISGGSVTVSEYEPPRRVVFQVRMGKLEPRTTFTVVPNGRGCEVTRRIEMEPQGLMRLMAPLMTGMLRRSNIGFLAKLSSALAR